MPPATRFATKAVHDLFRDEVSQLGGTVRDSFDDGQRLFARAVLKNFRPVADKDDVQAGVAIRAEEEQICVHPYVFRLVCKNGAIWAHALETVRIEQPGDVPEPVLAAELGAAIRACASPSAFDKAVHEMELAQSMRVDLALQLSAIFSGMGSRHADEVLEAILGAYDREGDATRFGLMNAITAAARDSDDPDTRWRLEELGAGVPVGFVPQSFKPGSARSLRQAYLGSIAEQPADLMADLEQRLELVGAGR
jgi:hypothetical protein